MSTKDLARALRTAFVGGETSFSSLEPPQELVGLVDACLAAQHGSGSGESDLGRLTDALVDITGDISRGKERGNLIGRTNAWLLVLGQLRQLEGEVMPSEYVLGLLWPTLIRRVLLQSGDLQLSRDGVAAAKSTLVWACKQEQPEGDALGPLELELLADYFAFTDFVDAEVDMRMRGTRARDRGSVHLEDVLTAVGKQRPKALLAHLARLLPNKPNQRAAILRLTGDFFRTHPAQAHHALATKLFDQLLLAVWLDHDVHVVQLALASIVALIPRILISIEPLLPGLFVGYARALGMVKGTRGRAEVRAEDAFDTEGPAPKFSLPVLREGVSWLLRHADPADSLKSSEYLALGPLQQLFTILYGLVPCNLTAFLKSPMEYLQEQSWKSPYADASISLFEPSELRERCELNLRAHTINPALLFGSSTAELSDLSKLAQTDAAAIALRCHHFTVPTELPRNISAPHTLDEDAMDSPDVSFSAGSQFDHADAYTTMRSTSETISASTSLSALVGSPSRGVPSSQQAARIAYLEREASVLRAELAYELYLKQQHSDRTGALHRERIKAASGDAERQALHDALRVYKSRLSNAESLVKQNRTEGSLSKAHSRDWSKRQQSRIASLRDVEKAARDREKSDEAKLQEAQATILAQSKELDAVGNRLLDLETQAKIDAGKLEETADLQARIQRLTAFLLAWDDDMSKARGQRKRMEAMVSEWQKATELQAADSRTIEGLKDEVAKLESKVQQLEEAKSRAPPQRPVDPDESPHARGQAILREQYKELRLKATKLEEELLQLKALKNPQNVQAQE